MFARDGLAFECVCDLTVLEVSRVQRGGPAKLYLFAYQAVATTDAAAISSVQTSFCTYLTFLPYRLPPYLSTLNFSLVQQFLDL